MEDSELESAEGKKFPKDLLVEINCDRLAQIPAC